MKAHIGGVIKCMLLIGLFVCLQPMIVSAHQSPVTCNSSNLDLTLTKNKTIVRQGEVIRYSVYVTNVNNGPSIACDISSATTTVTLPAKSGTATGNTVTLATGGSYPAGTTSTFLGNVDYTVNVDPGVTDVVAQAQISGTLHDAPVDHAAQITKTVGTSVTQPHVSLAKAANPTSGRGTFTVTYTYDLKNDSTTNAPMTNVALTDDQCSPLTLISGDVNGNGVLDTNETWAYTCKKTFSAAGNFTNTATANAIDSVDGRPIDPVTATATVASVGSGLPGLPKTGSGSNDNDFTWSHLIHGLTFMNILSAIRIT